MKPVDLLNHECLHYRSTPTGKVYPWLLGHSDFAAEGFSLPLTMICNSLDALLYMAIAGRGIACVTDFSARNAVADGRLETVLDTCVTGSDTIHIMWPSNRKMTPKVRVFVDFMLAQFGDYLVT